MDTTISFSNATKYYGFINGLNNLTLNIERGCSYGLLGRNGAGKTTAMKTLIGLCMLNSGEVRVLGQDPLNMSAGVKEKIAYVPQEPFLPEWMAVSDLVKLNTNVYPRWNRRYVDDLLQRYYIDTSRQVRVLSGGMKQMLSLILALGQDPEVLLLDEPAASLDPVAKQEFFDVLLDFLIDMDRTLLFSSHIMSDVEKIANRVGIMKQGKLFLDQELDDLKASVRQVQIDYTDTPPRTIDVPNLISLKSMANSVVLTIKDFDEHTLDNLKSITQVSDIKLLNLNFEEIFIELAK